MPWTGVARAAISGVASLFPALLRPLNGEQLNQVNFQALNDWATNIESLRAASFRADSFEIAGDLMGGYYTPDATGIWIKGSETSIGGGTTYWPYWQADSTSSSNARLIFPVIAPNISGCCLKSVRVISEHKGTAHGAVPGTPFRVEFYRGANNTGASFLDAANAADTASPAAYDAAQSRIVTPASGPYPTGTNPMWVALVNESGAGSQIGRRVRGISFLFSKA